MAVGIPETGEDKSRVSCQQQSLFHSWPVERFSELGHLTGISSHSELSLVCLHLYSVFYCVYYDSSDDSYVRALLHFTLYSEDGNTKRPPTPVDLEIRFLLVLRTQLRRPTNGVTAADKTVSHPEQPAQCTEELLEDFNSSQRKMKMEE